MSPPATNTRIDVTPAQGALRLLLTVTSDTRSESHELSVAEARALSLELIKQAYAAELRHRAREPGYDWAVATIPLRNQAQARG